MRSRIVVIGLVVVLAAGVLLTTGCQQLVGNAIKGAVEKQTGVKVDQSNGQVTVQGSNGESVTVGGAEGKLPEGFPADFPVWAGAKVKTGGKVANPTGTIYSVVWTSTDPLTKVSSEYTDAIKAAGFTVKNEVENTTGQNQAKVLQLEKGTDNVLVTMTDKNGETEITVIYTQKK